MRIPRLNIAEAWPTPAVDVLVDEHAKRKYVSSSVRLTELEFSCPNSLWGVLNEILGKVSLNTADHVVTVGLATFTDDTEGVVLHDRGPTDASQKTLLHAALEFEDCDLGRGDLDFDGDFTECNPGSEDAVWS
jgi:hypothetical protein